MSPELVIPPWAAGLISTFLVSLGAFAGLWLLALTRSSRRVVQGLLVYFAIGVISASLALHLLPKSFGLHQSEVPPFWASGMLIAAGFAGFLLLEWGLFYHSKPPSNPLRRAAPLILVGDSLHNFIDGILIAAGYYVSPEVGVTITLAVLVHELPQEVGDFGVLLSGGFSFRQALWYNFYSGLASILGAVLVISMGGLAQGLARYLLPFAAGNFLYILALKLVPALWARSNSMAVGGRVLLAGLGFGVVWVLMHWLDVEG